jgi:mono/diheme cytochrome c family protein
MRTLLVVGVLACLPAGCGRPTSGQSAESDGAASEFQPLYAQHCQGCHGADGRKGPAPPLNDPLFLAIIRDEQLHEVIGKGREHTLMPAFGGRQPDEPARLVLGPVVERGPLTEDQIDILVKGIRSNWAKPVEHGETPLPKYLSGKELDEELKGYKAGGDEVFQKACAHCHGTGGLGRTAEGKKSSAGALRQPAFLELTSNAMLRRIVITGRPDLGMPDFRKGDGRPLSPEQIRDVTALLASWREQR